MTTRSCKDLPASAPAPTLAPTPVASPSRKRKPPETCWGQELAGGGTHAKAEPLCATFQQRFCAACQRQGLLIPASRVRVHHPPSSTAPSNQHGDGVWNEAPPEGGAPSWPAHRVVNHTAGSVGPKLVVLRDPSAATLPGLLALPCAPGSVIAFRVGRTLQPVALPPLLLKSLPQSDPPPSLQPPPLESSSLPPPWPPPLASPLGQASSSSASSLPLACCEHDFGEAVDLSRRSEELVDQLLSPPDWPPDCTACSPAKSERKQVPDGTKRDCSASLPPSPPATPASLPFARRSWQLPALTPIQVSLALVVACVAFLTELYTNPVLLVTTAAGFATMAVANLAQTSPRFVARAMTLVAVCAPTLRLIQVLVSSPADVIDDLDRQVNGRLGVLMLAAGAGASFGALLPTTLCSTHKLLTAAYFACAVTCNAFTVRVRTGDDRMPSFQIVHGVVPFVVSFLTALATSGSNLEQKTFRRLPLAGGRLRGCDARACAAEW